MISVQQILNKTCYGLNLLSHIVRLDHPVQDGLPVSFSHPDNWPNPFDDYRKTLRITVVKLQPEAKMSDFIALYHDESGTIPDGNAVDFAGHYWGLQNQPLLEKINKDLYLHIGETIDFYNRSQSTTVTLPEKEPETPQEPSRNEPRITTAQLAEVKEQPRFSFFKRPITNIVPSKGITLADLYTYLTSDYAMAATAELRSIPTEEAAKRFKARNFDYATPAGIFTKRADSALVKPSGLIVIDIDDLKDVAAVEDTFQLLLNIPRLETQLLFRSPSGLGLKWVIEVVNNEGHNHRFFFDAVANFLRTYGIAVDPSGKDLSRACFLPCDKSAYINPKYLQ